MSKNFFVGLVLFWNIFLFSFSIKAQYDISGVDMEEDVQSWHDHTIGRENTGLLFGAYEKFERKSLTTHAFFHTDKWTYNKIYYRNEVYDSIPLLYDIDQDLLAMRHPNEFQYYLQPIKLIQHQVSWFEIDGYFFRMYEMDAFPSGFYQELFISDDIKLIVKRRKESKENSDLEVRFQPNHLYLLKYKDTYHRINWRYSWLRPFNNEKELKRKIRSFIRAEGIQIRKKRDEELIRLAKYCEELVMQNTSKSTPQ